MKISKILSASVLAGAVLFSGTACAAGSSDDKPAEASASAQVTPSETPTAEVTPAVDEREAAARTVNDYYSFVSDPDNLQKIQDAGAPLKGRGATATDAELQTLVESLPLGFQYFDTSTADLIKNAYVQLLMGASVMGSANMELTAPADSVTVTGDTATMDTSKIETIVDGKAIDAPANSSFPDLNMKKDDSGNWVMIAEEIEGMGSSSGSATATTEGSTTK
jgi:hypothetical protein